MDIHIVAGEPPDLALDARASCAFRDLVDDAKRFAMDFKGRDGSDALVSLVDSAMQSMASTLKMLSHRPVTQFYEAEIARLRELIQQQELTIQALGKAVAERETVGAR